MSDNYNTFVLTSTGYKNLKDLTPKDFVYDANSRLGRVTYKCTYPIKTHDIPLFSLITDSLDTSPYLIKNDVKVDIVDKTMLRRTLPVSALSDGAWVFHPWIKRDQLFFKTTIDLSKTTNNFYDVSYLYLFNNRILKIAEDLNIPQKAVKEILIREAADYEEYIPMVYDYIRLHFGIDSTPEEGSIESFKTFKQHVKNNYVFKMNRFINIDLDFTAFAISTLTRCKVNKTAPSDQSYVYELSYRFDTESDAHLLTRLQAFCNKVDIKHEIHTKKNITYVNVFNKPLFDYILNELLVDIDCIVNSSPECQEFFLENLFKDKANVITCRTVALQIKELFLYHNKVVGISEDVAGFSTRLVEDDFEELDSTVIITDDGYYSRIVLKEPLTEPYQEYTYFETQDRSTSLMTFTRK